MSPKLWILAIFLVSFSHGYVKNYYSIGGGISPGNSGGYSPGNNGGSINTNGGIGGGVQPNGYNNNQQKSAGSYCNFDAECSPGLSCTASVNGVKICLASNYNPSPSTGSGTCQTSSNCASNSICVVSNGVGNCQIQVGGNIRQEMEDFKLTPKPGCLNSECDRDSDCNPGLFCTLYFGELMCRESLKPLLPLRCETQSDCPSTEYLCVFSTAMQDRVCYKYGDTVTDGYVIPIQHKLTLENLKTTSATPPPKTTTTTYPSSTEIFEESHAIFPSELTSSALEKRENLESGPTPPKYMRMSDDKVIQISASNDDTTVKTTNIVIDEENAPDDFEHNEPIDPAAIVCEFDYHCRMGESCSGNVRFVDKNVKVCRYDIMKKNRQCIFHSDCLSGQRCVTTSNNTATCQTDISATLGEISCFYDYQCSGGEKCTRINIKNEEKFVCRPSQTSDPRNNQLCTSNAECPFQQVCRRSSGIAMCIDLAMSKNPSLVQQRVIQFFRTFIF